MRVSMSMPKYSRADVAQNNGRSGAPTWIIIKDVVYDVTKFVNEHPGGASEVTQEAGKDATKAFKDVGHSTDADEILEKLKIGEIIDEEKHYDSSGKKKKVVAAQPEKQPPRSCLSVCTCGLLG